MRKDRLKFRYRFFGISEVVVFIILFLILYSSQLQLLHYIHQFVSYDILQILKYTSLMSSIFISHYFIVKYREYLGIREKLLQLICKLDTPPYKSPNESSKLPLKVIVSYSKSNEYVQHVLGADRERISVGYDSSDIDTINDSGKPKEFNEERFLYKYISNLGRLKKRDWSGMHKLLKNFDEAFLELLPENILKSHGLAIYNIRENAMWEITDRVISGRKVQYSANEIADAKHEADILRFLNIVLVYLKKDDLRIIDNKQESYTGYKDRKKREVCELQLTEAIVQSD